MDPKQKMMLGVAGGVAAVVIIGLAVCLFSNIGTMQDAEALRNDNDATLIAKYSKRPTKDAKTGAMKGAYPSKANLDILKADREAYTKVGDLARALLEPALDIPAEETPSQFVMRIGSVIRSLNDRQLALKGSSTVEKVNEPLKDYSFTRYFVNGEMPAAEHVPRLAKQFAVIEHVCTLLLDSGATEIKAVTRQEFDKAKTAEEPQQPTRRSRRSRQAAAAAPVEAGATEVPAVLAKDGVTCESYTITFASNYASLVPVFNKLSTEALFIVIQDVAIASDFALPAKQKNIVESHSKPKRGASKDEETADERFANAAAMDRLLTDPERLAPLQVTLKFAVYSVPPTATDDAEADTEADATKGN